MTRCGPLWATATNLPLPYVTEFQLTLVAAFLAVHVTPSTDDITRLLLPSATATYIPFPYVTDVQLLPAGSVR
jgi:hypothetical protein